MKFSHSTVLTKLCLAYDSCLFVSVLVAVTAQQHGSHLRDGRAKVGFRAAAPIRKLQITERVIGLTEFLAASTTAKHHGL